jgi:hypothetical protein
VFPAPARHTTQLESTVGSIGDTRTYRTTLTQRLNRTLARLLLRHAVEHVELGKARVGLITHRIRWHRNHAYRFVLDFDAGAVSIPSLAPGSPPQDLLRELRNVMRPAANGPISNGTAANGTAERESLDPEKGEVRTFVKHGSLTISITVRNDAYEYCAEYLVELAGEVLNAYTTAAESSDALRVSAKY